MTTLKIFNPSSGTFEYITSPPLSTNTRSDITGVLKGDSSGYLQTAVPNVDYVTPNYLGSLNLTQYLSDTSSNISDYRYLADASVSSTIVSSSLTVGNDQYLFGFIRNSQELNISNLLKGTYTVRIQTYKNSYTDSGDIYFKVYRRGYLGNETLLMTSNFASLSVQPTVIDITSILNNTANINTTDSIVIKFFANVYTTLQVYIDTSNSFFTSRTLSAVSDSVSKEFVVAMAIALG